MKKRTFPSLKLQVVLHISFDSTNYFINVDPGCTTRLLVQNLIGHSHLLQILFIFNFLNLEAVNRG